MKKGRLHTQVRWGYSGVPWRGYIAKICCADLVLHWHSSSRGWTCCYTPQRYPGPCVWLKMRFLPKLDCNVQLKCTSGHCSVTAQCRSAQQTSAARANSSLITHYTAPSLSQCQVTANQSVTSQTTGNVSEKGDNWARRALWNGCSWPAQGELEPFLLCKFSQQQPNPDPVLEEISAPCASPQRMSDTGSAPNLCMHELKACWAHDRNGSNQCWFTFLNRCCHTGTSLSQGINCPSCCAVCLD